MTPKERLQHHLESGKSVNPLSSWLELGIYRTASRIHEIRKEYEVKDRWIEVKNQFGELVKVKEYYLEK